MMRGMRTSATRTGRPAPTPAAGSTGTAAAAAPGPALHHRPGGFRNLHATDEPKGLAELLRWRWQARREGLPRPPAAPVPTVVPDLGFIAANARADAAMQPAVTWIGHATVLAQFGGWNVLTDPIWSPRCSPLSGLGPLRAQPPGLALASLPRIDLVLVSHDHYDHLDLPSVRALAAQRGGAPLFVVPLGVKAWMDERGIAPVAELDWWQTLRHGALEIVCTPAQHWSGRSPFGRMRTLWSGFAVLAPGFHLYYSGDTGYSPHFVEIRDRLRARQADGGFDLALLPIGAYEPRWFMQTHHVDPAEAVRIHRELGARRSLGIHWGTFAMTDEALDEPPRALAAARRAAGLGTDEFFVLAVGQTCRLPRRGASAPAIAPDPGL